MLKLYQYYITTGFCLLFSPTSFAQIAEKVEPNWLDNSHDMMSNTLQDSADVVNSWFGENQPDRRAQANIRVMIDNYWDESEGYSIKPRIRGRLRVPNLENRLHVIFGDEALENQLEEPADIVTENPREAGEKRLDIQQTRQNNSSVGLKWLVPNNRDHLETDLSAGLRSHGDIYVKATVEKDWYLSDELQSHGEIIYRYGLKSEHYMRSNIELREQRTQTSPALQSQLSVEYRHHDDEERWNWGESISRKHPTGEDTWFNYGIYAGGRIHNNGNLTLDSYGPFAGLRMNAYRNWIFIQPEITYYNNEPNKQNHQVGAMLRLEAHF